MVLKNEGMVFDHVTSPLPVVVGVGVFSCLMFHVKLLKLIQLLGKHGSVGGW